MGMNAVQFLEVSRAPTVNDDSADYAVEAGTIWRNSVNGDLYICTSPANGAAVWKKFGTPAMVNVQATGTTLAPTAAQSGTRFIVSNAGAVAVTLPAVAEGLVYEFVRTANEEIVVSSTAGDDMVVGNDVEADSVTFTTTGQQIGCVIRVEGILVGTTPKWLVTLPSTPFGTGLTGGFAYSIAS